jgi:hypothetical protein
MDAISRHLRSSIVGYVALFIALGLGSAYAADKIGSKDIAKNAVKAKHIAKGQVKTPKVANGAISDAKLSAAVRQQISDLQATVQTQQAKLTNLQGTVQAQQTKISALQTLLAGVSRQSVDGHPTLRFSGMNVQVVNGTGTTDGTPNKLGNLIIGYNEQRSSSYTPAARTGSHYLVVGAAHEWTSFGGLLAGFRNTAGSDYSSVSGGIANTASGYVSSVSGGSNNTATHNFSSVSGGYANTASGSYSSVSGGYDNTASGTISSVLGGLAKTASGAYSCYPACP